jgi:hypothetical protein
MPHTIGRTAYCRYQAAECAAAATATTLAEVKEAYHNLEQGWLQLAPEIEGSRIFSINPDPGQGDQDPKSEQPIQRRSRSR